MSDVNLDAVALAYTFGFSVIPMSLTEKKPCRHWARSQAMRRTLLLLRTDASTTLTSICFARSSPVNGTLSRTRYNSSYD